MTLPYDMARCNPLRTSDGKPVYPCTTCARHVQAKPTGPRTPWITITPAFFNGERYVCEQHMELRK